MEVNKRFPEGETGDYKRRFYEEMYRDSDEELGRKPASGRLSGITRSRYEVIYGLLPGGDKLLDVGCGTGNFALAARGKYEQVYGVDITDSMVGRAVKNADENVIDGVHFSRADADVALPFEDSFFDTVTCIATLQFMFNPYHVLGEFNRVLKRNGALVLQVVNIAFLPRRISLMFGRFPETAVQAGWDGGTLHYFTFSSLSGLMKETGFRVTAKSNSGLLAGIRGLWPSILSSDAIIKGVKL